MNKYEVLGIVGEGAYGVVLRCRNKETDETIAIKKFKESEDDDVVRKTTLREVKILRQLRHPCIVSLREAFRRKGKLYLVFEYVERNLLEVLEGRPSGLSPDTVRRYVFQLCMAIDWCHSHGVIHRDIKPENLLVDSAKGALKLCDFGFARVMPPPGSSRASSLTDYVATRWYRAPELLLGCTDYSTPVDVWAIGCIMGELADGQPLFPGESDVDQLYVIQQGIGPMTSGQMERFLKAKRFRGLKFPDMRRTASLADKYGGVVAEQGVAFMKACLFMDPTRRLTAREAVLHPFFAGLPEEYGWSPFDAARADTGASAPPTRRAAPAPAPAPVPAPTPTPAPEPRRAAVPSSSKVTYQLSAAPAPAQHAASGSGGDSSWTGHTRSDSRGGARSRTPGTTTWLGTGTGGAGGAGGVNTMTALGGRGLVEEVPRRLPSRGGSRGGMAPPVHRALSRGGHRSGGGGAVHTMGVMEASPSPAPTRHHTGPMLGGGLGARAMTESVVEAVGGKEEEYEDEWEDSKSPALALAPSPAPARLPARWAPVAYPEPITRRAAAPAYVAGAGPTRTPARGAGASYYQDAPPARTGRTKAGRRRKGGASGAHRPSTRGAPVRRGAATPAAALPSRAAPLGAVYGVTSHRPSTRADGPTGRTRRTKGGLPAGAGRRVQPPPGTTRRAGGSTAAAVAQARAHKADAGAVQLPGMPLAEIPAFGQRGGPHRLQPLGEGGRPENTFQRSEYYVAPLPAFGNGGHK